MKPLRIVWLWLALGGGAFTQQACGRPTFVVAQYAGPVQPRETLGIVRVNGDESLELLSLDGEPTSARVVEDARLHVEVLPGKHTVFVQDSRLPNVPSQRVRFVAEAGRVYRPVFVQVDGLPSARVYEVDLGSDALLRDVTTLEAPEPETPFTPARRKSPQAPPTSSPPAAPATQTPAGSAAPPATREPLAPPVQEPPPSSPAETPSLPEPPAGNNVPGSP